MQATPVAGAPPSPSLMPNLESASPAWATEPHVGANGTWAMHVFAADFRATPAALLGASTTHASRVTLVDTTLWCGPSLAAAQPAIAAARRGAVFARPVPVLSPNGGGVGGAVRGRQGTPVIEAGAVAGSGFSSGGGAGVPTPTPPRAAQPPIDATWPAMAAGLASALGVAHESSAVSAVC